MELLRFSVFWCGTILFGSIVLEEAGELNFNTARKVVSAAPAFSGFFLPAAAGWVGGGSAKRYWALHKWGNYDKLGLYSLFCHTAVVFVVEHDTSFMRRSLSGNDIKSNWNRLPQSVSSIWNVICVSCCHSKCITCCQAQPLKGQFTDEFVFPPFELSLIHLIAETAAFFCGKKCVIFNCSDHNCFSR